MTDITGNFRSMRKKLADGRVKFYYYTDPGGTKFFECFDLRVPKPYPFSFVDAFNEAIASERGRGSSGDFATIVFAYIDSAKFRSLAEVTRVEYERDLEDAVKVFGSYGVDQIEDRSFRGKIVAWQEQVAQTSASRADRCVATLSSALGYAYRKGQLTCNPAFQIEKIHRKEEVNEPWTEDEIRRFREGCPQHILDIFDLAFHTGMRCTDLSEVKWSAYNGSDIQWRTSKSRRKTTAVIPITSEGQKFLEDLKVRQLGSRYGLQPVMIVGARGKQMQPHSLSKKVCKRTRALGIDKSIHNLRNNRATALIRAGFSSNEVAMAMGWELRHVENIIRVYVHRDELTAAQVRRLETARSRTS